MVRRYGVQIFRVNISLYIQGPVVQNLTKLRANVMLKFISKNMAKTLIFFAEKMC